MESTYAKIDETVNFILHNWYRIGTEGKRHGEIQRAMFFNETVHTIKPSSFK